MNQAHKVLLICSGGGHWVQMSKLLPALDGKNIQIATVDTSVSAEYPQCEFIQVPDFNRSEPVKVIKGFGHIFQIVHRSEASWVISTGAAPGLMGLLAAKLLRKKTMWIDSVANPKQLSMSGRIASYFADELLTQWPALSRCTKAKYRGRII